MYSRATFRSSSASAASHGGFLSPRSGTSVKSCCPQSQPDGGVAW